MLKFCTQATCHEQQFTLPNGHSKLLVLLNNYGTIISREEFLELSDLTDLLEDGWSEDDCLSSAERFFQIKFPGHSLSGYIDSGCYFIFTESGEFPELPDLGDENSRELAQLYFDSLGWTLQPVNSPLLKLDIDETESVILRSNTFNVFETSYGNYRFQKLTNEGEVIGAMFVKDGVIDTVYTDYAARKTGVASSLYQLALNYIPDLRHSATKTPNGQAWADAIDRKKFDVVLATELSY